MSEKIIQKGEYTHETSSMPVVPKQYIITEGKDAKQLLLRFENRSDEMLTSIKFNLIQYGVGDKVLKEETYEFNVKVQGNTFFAPKKDMPLAPACIDFEIDIITVTYGNFAYTKDGDSVKSVFIKREKNKPLEDRTEFYAAMHEKRYSVKPKTLNKFAFFIPLIAVVVIALSLLIGKNALAYTSGKDSFTLKDITYRFTEPDNETSPIEIIAYVGKSDRVKIPSEIEGHKIVSIGTSAFAGTSIKEISIECEDIVISASAFYDCKRLTNITMTSVIEISTSAFEGCTNLVSIDWGNKLKAISDRAFFGCKFLSEANLPEGLETIGAEAFKNCISLEILKIPASVTSIGQNFMENCSDIEILEIPYVGYSRDFPLTITEFLGAPDLRPSLKSLTIGSDGRIDAKAFENEKYLEKIVFTGKITEIGTAAFKGASSLKEFTIPEDVVFIGAEAFKGCYNLRIFNLNAKVTVIPDEMLFNCSSLASFHIPSTVTSVGIKAFSGCSSINSLSFPTSVTSIGNDVISGCSSLQTLKFGNLPTYGTIAYFAGTSRNLRSLETIEITYAVSVPSNAFAKLTALKTVKLPNDIVSIGDNSFQGCSSLTNFDIPASVTSIGSNAFSGCSSLVSVTIPQIKIIKDGTFNNCSSLTNITIPESVTTIGESAFRNCSSITAFSIPASVTSMGLGVFENCQALKEITLPFIGTSLGESDGSLVSLFKSPDETQNIYGSYVPWYLSKVTVLGGSISSKAFTSCSNIKEVVLLGNTTKIIEQGAFENCTSLKKITLPLGLETIEDGAFFGCQKLYTAINKTGVDFSAIASEELKETVIAYFANEEDIKATIVSDFNMMLGSDGFWYATDFVQNNNYSETLDFPQSFEFEGSTVSEYKIAHAFNYGSYFGSATKINIPASVIEIGNSAFYSFTSLNTVNFDNASKLKRIGENAFYNCSNLKALNLNNATSLEIIDASAFAYCHYLRYVALPSSLTEIKDMAFDQCYYILAVFNTSSIDLSADDPTANGRITEYPYKIFNCAPQNISEGYISGLNIVTLNDIAFILGREPGNSSDSLNISASNLGLSPVSSIYITNNAFNYDTNLKSLVIGSDVDFIGNNAFAYCQNLTSLSIEHGLEKIGQYAFQNTAISRLTIPSSVTELGASAFYSNSFLEEVNNQSSVTKLPYELFAYCYKLRSVTIPADVTEIDYYAFSGDTIYEVVNYSALEIIPASYDYGNLTAYAIRVSAPGAERLIYNTIESNGVTALFARDSQGTYLCELRNESDNNLVVMPNFTVNGFSVRYEIHSSFYMYLYNTSYIFIPSSVSKIGEVAISHLYSYTLYFDGTKEMFAEIIPVSYPIYNVYYYSECVHENGYWRYDEFGIPTTEFSECKETEITKESCTEMGEYSYTCEVCGYTYTLNTPQLPHEYENGICKGCGKAEEDNS